MTTEEDVTRNLTLIEYYKEQLSSIDMQMQYLQAAMADYQKAKMTIEQLEKTEEKTDIIVPVGSGVYINALAKDTSKVLLDIGAGVVTEKTVENALKKIDERIEYMQESQKKLLTIAQQVQAEATELSEKTQKLMAEAKQ